MSAGFIKDIRQSGSTLEILFAADDGNLYTVPTNGTKASLIAGLQAATAKASDLKTKPELSVGMAVDFTPVVPVVVPPTQAEIDRATFYTQVGHELALARFASLSPDTQKLCSDPAWIDGMPR